MPSFRRPLFVLTLGLLAAAVARHVADARALRIGVLRSAHSLRVSGWMGGWETAGSIETLRTMGLDVWVLSDEDLEHGRLDGIDVLVVPSARCVPVDGAARVAEWVQRGGRLLATGMAAYRDGKNQRVGPDNNFQWADLYGADFQRWLSAWPHCEYLALDKALAGEVGTILGRPPLRRIELGRNTAMLVRARPTTQVLATWLSADGKTPTTDSGSASAAIVQNGRVIFCGENLLTPELARSPEVLALICALVHRLDASAPAQLPAELRREPQPLSIPKAPVADVQPGGPTLRVGIHDHLTLAGVTAADGVAVEVLSPKDDAVGPSRFVIDKGLAIVTPFPGPNGRTCLTLRFGGHPPQTIESGLTFSAVKAHQPVEFLQLRPNGTCHMQAFRGAIELKPRGNAMSVVNNLSVEEYVAGVIPNETPAVYPLEALKTMAVVARTFGLSRIGYHKREGYDVCNSVDCQMYGGYLTEWDVGNRAANATRGEVIRYDGKLTYSTFHAVCGGILDDIQNVWPDPPCPYLVSVADGPAPIGDLSSDDALRAFLERPPDSYCSTSPRFRWKEKYTLAQLQAMFEKSLPVTLGTAYHGLGTLHAVRVMSRSKHGRVLTMQIEGSAGTYVVEKDRIRWLWSGGRVGQGGLQSTLFRIETEPDGTLEFQGGGWGHGVGMCQEGAAGMADRGFDYHAIILHYYPHTTIAPLTGPSGEERQRAAFAPSGSHVISQEVGR